MAAAGVCNGIVGVLVHEEVPIRKFQFKRDWAEAQRQVLSARKQARDPVETKGHGDGLAGAENEHIV